MEKQEFESSVYTDYEDRFQFFLGVAFIFLLLSLLISEKKSKWSQKVKLFES
jgi:Ca-activated chloride channel family protein